MLVISDIGELRAYLSQQSNIAFVPTMGNLHQGHLDLVKQARQCGEQLCVVVSIFVNPLQFGPQEDFDRYPRTLAADCQLLEGLADLVFAPDVGQMYPCQQTLFVEPPPVANQLCGANRPGHFRGMATVVLKLFNIVQPNYAVFGKKDYQQLFIIRQMVAQFNLPIQIIGGETIRAEDGLALSSRNGYLSPSERTEAPRLQKTLQQLRLQILATPIQQEQFLIEARQALQSHGWVVDYLELRDCHTLMPANSKTTQQVLLAAAKLGNTRLLDNLEL